jgi:N-acetylglutamate synthase-like GNAT family acetyltransferase
MPVTIRTATAADQPTIRQMIKEANLNRMSLNWPNFVVAEDNGAIVGVGQVKTHGDGSRELASMAVVPARQGDGIGSAIIKTLIAQEPGVLHLTCRRELGAYYKRFGFRRLEAPEYPPYFRRLIPIVNVVARVFGVQILVMRREAADAANFGAMAKTGASRPERLAVQFEAAHENFIRVVESLTGDQWRMRGKNTPGMRINDEDEARPLGVIAHHVAVNEKVIMGRIQAILSDSPTPTLKVKETNARHANEYADTTKSEVLTLLQESGSQIAKDLRTIPDKMLDKVRELPTGGSMTVEQRIERVLIGHLQGHQGSIEATIA